MIAFIGCGGAGGNVVNYAAQKGFVTGAINYSQKDLDSLQFVTKKLKLSGSDGAGHNRDEAISMFTEQYEVVAKWIKENFDNPTIEIIILATSASGGSGGGISPILLDVLESLMPDKVFSAIAVLPDETESITSQVNSINVYDELSKLDISVLPVDNQQVKERDKYASKNKIYTMTNTDVIDRLETLYTYTELHSQTGNFDKKDFKTIFSTKGILIITEVKPFTFTTDLREQDLSIQGVAKCIQHGWQHSMFTPAQKQYVTRAALIFDGNPDYLSYINHEEIFKYFEKGMPLDLFEGFYSEDRRLNRIITVLAGLPWITDRLQYIDELVSEQSKKVEEILSDQPSFQAKSSNLLNGLKKPTVQQKTVEKPMSQLLSEKLNKYKR